MMMRMSRMNAKTYAIIILLFTAAFFFAGCGVDGYEPDRIPESYLVECDVVRKAFADTLLIESVLDDGDRIAISFTDGSEAVFDDVYDGAGANVDAVFINKIEIHEGSVEFSLSNGGFMDIPMKSYLDAQLKREREAMYAICSVVYGGQWESIYDREGLADKPLGEWLSICRGDRYGRNVWINMYPAYEKVELPSQIGAFENLHTLVIQGSGNGGLVGAVPKEIGLCRNLRRLELNRNWITALPEELSDCRKLLRADLSGNNIKSIPENLGYTDLVYLNLSDNQMEGFIPRSVTGNDRLWSYSWGMILKGNWFNTEDDVIPGPEFKTEDINAEIIDSVKEYGKNKLTVILQCGMREPYSEREIEMFKLYYRQYSDDGLNVIGICHGKADEVKAYAEERGIKWRIINESWYLKGEASTLPNPYKPDTDIWTFKDGGYPVQENPTITIVDSKGRVVCESIRSTYGECHKYIENFFAGVPVDPTVPDKPSVPSDVEVKVLSESTEGEGINLILMGDAFSLEWMSSGLYEKTMRKAMDSFFAVEPFKTYRNCFNVSMVSVVSQVYDYAYSSPTALDTWIDGISAGGDDVIVLEYAKKAVPEESLEESVIIVLINEDTYAGTSYLYPPTSGDCGNGISIAYIPVCSDASDFSGLIRHEAGGHCFGKLADEYSHQQNGEIPSDVVSDVRRKEDYGWYRNVDFTSDLTEVKWKHFINDRRYEYDGLGAFQGAMAYWSGIWKPTGTSVMRYNDLDFFNAPSREAVYYRIHKLAYGEDWQYDFEKFVEYDAVNIHTDPWTAPYSHGHDDRRPLPPPVIK